jgi:hypothetical protein
MTMPFWHTLKPPGIADLQIGSCSKPGASRCAGSENAPAGPASGNPDNGHLSPDPVRWAQSLLGFVPDTVQSEILRSNAARLILCCTRQFGKSTITSIKALQHAWSRPNSLVLAAAPTARQSGEWLEKSRFFLSRLGIRSRSDGHNRLSLVLPNGSRLVGLPGVADNVRGFSKASLILIDEAAYVADELYQALNPMLAVSGGGLWLMSTPAAQSGFFFEEWSRAAMAKGDSLPEESFEADSGTPSALPARTAEPPSGSGFSATALPATTVGPPSGSGFSATALPAPPVSWDSFRVTAEQCPRIRAEFLAEQRVLLGDSVFRREYMCEFVAAGTQIIDRELLDDALDPGLSPFNGGSPLWR